MCNYYRCQWLFRYSLYELNGSSGTDLTATINSNYNGEDVSCAGACDGIVFATATGGTLLYQSFTWSTPGAGIGDTMTVACVGAVDVIVTDANGCTATASVTLTEPSAVTATITAFNDATCNGQCDGDATDGQGYSVSMCGHLYPLFPFKTTRSR